MPFVPSSVLESTLNQAYQGIYDQGINWARQQADRLLGEAGVASRSENVSDFYRGLDPNQEQFVQWEKGQTLHQTAFEKYGDSFRWQDIIESNVDVSEITESALFGEFNPGEFINLPSLDTIAEKAEEEVNKILIGTGGSVKLDKQGLELFLDFSQIAEKNSTLSKIKQSVCGGTQKLLDFRF